MNAAIYARVSTDWQAERGYSLETQVQECRKKANEIGADSVKEYVDDGYSGAYLERPAMDSLREAVRNKLFDAVICYDPDRLSRNLAHQLIITDDIEGSGAQLLFVNSNYENTSEGKLFYAIRGAFSGYEREKIRERTMRGKRAKLKSGKVITDSHVFGYTFDKDTCTYYINEQEAETVKKIFELYLSGEIGGIDAITRWLDAHSDEYPPRTAKWCSASVNNILKRQMYTGHYYAQQTYHKKTGVKSAVKLPRPKEDWIAMEAPAIIDEVTFKRAQEVRNRNRTYAVWHPRKGVYLFMGLLICGKCGRKLAIVQNHRKNGSILYYACHARAPYNKPYSCGAKGMILDVIEDVLWKMLESICKSEKSLREYINTVEKKRISAPTDTAKITTRLEKVRKERQAVMKWFSASLISDEEATQKLESLKRQEEGLQEKLAHAAPNAAESTIDIKGIVHTMRTVRTTPEERRKAVLAVVDNIVIQRHDNRRNREYDLTVAIHFKSRQA